MKNLSLIALILIVLLASILRFPLLDKYSPGVTPDEIQQGYSAYSILLTGRDEWGDFLPIFPRSFGDYRPPLYVYLTIPAVALFGLNIESVRLPSAIFGVLSVLLIYFLGKELFKSKTAGIAAAFILAISNWHVFYSRSAWESNPGALLFLAGVLFFIKSFKNAWFLIISSALFGLSVFSYYSFKLFVPIFVLGLLVIYFKKIIKMEKRILLIAFCVLGIFLGTMVIGDMFGGGGRRASDAAIYNEENIVPLRNIQIEDKLPQPWGRVINNRMGYLFTQFGQNYLGYFSTTFFASPHRPDSSLYNLSGEWLLSFWEVLLVGLAVVYIIRKWPENSKIIILWAVLAPIPAALTRNYMHVQRVEVLLFLIPILAAFGLNLVLNLTQGFQKKIFVASFLAFAFFTLAIRVDHYLFHTFTRNLGGVHYGYKEISDFVQANHQKYDGIIFTKDNSEPHIFLAFYSKMDPKSFQNDAQGWKYFEKEGFKFVDQINYKMGKFYFRPVEFEKDKLLNNTLIIGSEREIPPGTKGIYEVKDPFGKVLFKAVDTNSL